MNDYGTATSPSTDSSSGRSRSTSPESTPLLLHAYDSNGFPYDDNINCDGGAKHITTNRIIIAFGIFWVASVVYLANMGNSILQGMQSGTGAASASSGSIGRNGGGTRLSQYSLRWSDIITPLIRRETVSSVSESDNSSGSLSSTTDATDTTAAIDSPAMTTSTSTTRSTTFTTSPSSNHTNITVMIVYGPEYHHCISQFAWEVARGVISSYDSHLTGITGQLVFGHTDNLTFWDVVNADAIIVGSPVYNGNTHPYVQQWINNFQIQSDLSRKVGAAFVTAGGLHAGADGTLMSILRSLMIFQMVAVGGATWDSPFGAAATVYEEPFGDHNVASPDFPSACYENVHGTIHPHFLQKAFSLGERVANITFALNNSTK